MDNVVAVMNNILPAEIEPYDQQYIWIVVVGFSFAFILAIAVGGKL